MSCVYTQVTFFKSNTDWNFFKIYKTKKNITLFLLSNTAVPGTSTIYFYGISFKTTYTITWSYGTQINWLIFIYIFWPPACCCVRSRAQWKSIDDLLPIARTCDFSLLLPAYRSHSIMGTKLLRAISEQGVWGLPLEHCPWCRTRLKKRRKRKTATKRRQMIRLEIEVLRTTKPGVHVMCTCVVHTTFYYMTLVYRGIFMYRVEMVIYI